MTRLRIGLVTRQYAPGSLGGIGTYVETVAAHLRTAGHEPVVIHSAPGQHREVTWGDGVRVERFAQVGPEWLWSLTTKLSFHLTERVRAALSAWRAVRELPGFDVIEAPEWKAEGLLLRWARRGPVVVHLHLLDRQVMASTGVEPGLGRRASSALELRAARWAHAVTATTRRSAYISDGTAAIDPDILRVVTPPLRSGRWREVAPVGRTAPTVLCIGRLEPRKAPEIVVRALGRISSVPDLRAVFVGQPYDTTHGEPYDAYLHRLAQDAGISCELVPATADPDDLCALLAAARVVAVPSRFETLSMVTLEAMAAGRPVVVSSTVGVTEWITDRGAAPVVDVDDIDGWAAALERFLADPDAAADAGVRNRAHAIALTEPESVVASRVAVYDEVRSARRAAPRIRSGVRR